MKSLAATICLNLVLAIVLFSEQLSAAEIQQCVQSPSRTEQCNNLVYRGAQHPKTGKRFIFCFCRADMDHLTNDKLTETELLLNKMEWQQILAETGYTDKQLRRLISK